MIKKSEGPSGEERADPNLLLEQLRREEKGYHKVFIGFAAGVGKTCEMLTEANRRNSRGEDIVVGFVETHGREWTENQIGSLEVIPRRKIQYSGIVLEEMDTEAILERNPKVVLVDELAHTNVPGSLHEKRWQDVEQLLEAGIGVLSTINVQHIESLNDTIYDITGIKVRETVPDRILHEASEVMMVDLPVRALLNRLERGAVYPFDKVEQALQGWFQQSNLTALREIALREIAQEVDDDLETYRHSETTTTKSWAATERIMVCITPSSTSMRLLRRGSRIAQRLKAEIVAVYVEKDPQGLVGDGLKKNVSLAKQLGVSVVSLQGEPATEIIKYAREKRITQLVVGHSERSRWEELRHGSIVNRLTKELRNVDILLVSADD